MHIKYAHLICILNLFCMWGIESLILNSKCIDCEARYEIWHPLYSRRGLEPIKLAYRKPVCLQSWSQGPLLSRTHRFFLCGARNHRQYWLRRPMGDGQAQFECWKWCDLFQWLWASIQIQARADESMYLFEEASENPQPGSRSSSCRKTPSSVTSSGKSRSHRRKRLRENLAKLAHEGQGDTPLVKNRRASYTTACQPLSTSRKDNTATELATTLVGMRHCSGLPLFWNFWKLEMSGNSG